MMTTDERMRILQMIQNNKITAQEGAQLLETMSANKSAGYQRPPTDSRSSQGWFRVRVTDLYTGNAKATVNIPLSVIDWGLKMGSRYSGEFSGIDIEELKELLRTEADGKLVDVVDEQDGEHVEIFVD